MENQQDANNQVKVESNDTGVGPSALFQLDHNLGHEQEQEQGQDCDQKHSEIESYVKAKRLGPNGKPYWYHKLTKESFWYNPGLAKKALRLLDAGNQPDSLELEHLNLYRKHEQEKEKQQQQQQPNETLTENAYQKWQREKKQREEETKRFEEEKNSLIRAHIEKLKAEKMALKTEEEKRKEEERKKRFAEYEAEQKRKLEIRRQQWIATEEQRKHQLEAERKRKEEERRQHLAMLEVERKRKEEEKKMRLAMLEAEQKRKEAARKEWYEKARIASFSKARALLKRYLDSIGWESNFVSSDVIEDAILLVQPTETTDMGYAFFERAVKDAAIPYESDILNKAKTDNFQERKNKEMLKRGSLSFYGIDESKLTEKQNQIKEDFFKFFSIRSKTISNTQKRSNEEEKKAKAEKAKHASMLPQSNVATRPRRSTKSRLVKVGGHMVLKENNYNLEEGIQTFSSVTSSQDKKPKAAKSAYMFFSNETATELRQAQPEIEFREVQQMVATKWRDLTESEKAVYVNMALRDKVRYSAELQKLQDEKETSRLKNEKLLEDRARETEEARAAYTSSLNMDNTTDSNREHLVGPNSNSNVQQGGINYGELLGRSSGAPRPNYRNLIEAALLSLGARAPENTPERIHEWVTTTALGKMMTARFNKVDYEKTALLKACRKGTNNKRFDVFVAPGMRYRKSDYPPMQLPVKVLNEIAHSVPLSTARLEERERKKTEKEEAETSTIIQNQNLKIDRIRHNNEMKKDIFHATLKQWAFMIRNRKSIETFITEDVKKKMATAETLLRTMGHGELLEKDPCGYEDGKLSDEEQNKVENTSTENIKENNKSNIKLQKRIKRKTIKQPNDIYYGDMRPYQLEGLRWLVSTYENGVNSILADEMGLGKTLQTISFLTHIRFEMKHSGPFLVIVPLSVLTAWFNEFKRWSPKLKVIRLHTTGKNERERIKNEVLSNFEKFDVVLTTYEMVISSSMKYVLSSKIIWRYVVIDEGHKIKNHETDLASAVRSINSLGRLLLTGTPLQNNLLELWALLNYLYPDIFTSQETFEGCFNLAKQIVDKERLESAHYLLRPFVLRRTKGEVEQKLPPKEEIEIKVPLSEMQKFWYKKLLMKDAKLLQRVEATIQHSHSSTSNVATAAESSTTDWKRLQSLMMQLRKCCNHPFLFSNADMTVTDSEDIVEASGKLKLLDRLLKRLYEKGHRVVIFSQFTAMLDILQDFMKLRGYKYSRLDGSTNRVQRAIDIMEYNKDNSQYFAYLMSTRAGGLGINLYTGDTVILYDSDWNPQVDLQAMDRVHRIGQTKPVHVYRLVASGTVEERVVQRAKKKLYLDKMVNRGSTSQAEQLESLGKAEMLKMLRFGASAVVKSEEGNAGISDKALENLMDRSRMLEGSHNDNDKGNTTDNISESASLNALDFDGTQEAIDIRQLDGVTYDKDKAPSKVEKNIDLNDYGNESESISFTDTNSLFAQEDAKVDLSTNKKKRKNLSMKDISEEWTQLHQPKAKRIKKTRFIKTENGYTILKANNYTMEEGGKSVFASELGNQTPKLKVTFGGKKGRQIAGRDYDHEGHCLMCWDGGSLLCCDQCTLAYHTECLAPWQLPQKKANGASVGNSWGCPHHYCRLCTRKAHEVGGMLFRCTECPSAYCEDHVPMKEARFNESGRETRFEELGQSKPPQAYFMQCGPNCIKFRETRLNKGILAAIQESQKRASAI